jgi:hypothetical protein
VTLSISRRMRSEISELHDEGSLALRLRYPEKWHSLVLLPTGRDEPAWREYAGKAAVKAPKNKFDGDAKWVITQQRLLIVVHPGLGTVGLSRPRDEHALVAVELSDLSSPEPRRKKLGTAFRRLRVTGSSGSFVIELGLAERMYPNLVSALSGGAAELDQAYAGKLNEKRRERKAAEAEAAAVAERAVAERLERESHERAARFETHQARRPGLGGVALRPFDHKRTWQFRVAASPAACIEAFERGFAKQVVLLRGRWSVTHCDGEARAIYRGRGGVMRVATGLSQMSSAEQEGAVGSEVRFVIDESDDQHTICSMWLAN